MNFIFALMPLSIGLGAIGLLRGWLVLRKKETGEPMPIKGFFRVCVWGCAVLSTFAGVCCLLQLFGVLDASLRH